MDIDFFLKERTKFTRFFHENAPKPFIGIMDAIDNGDSPN